MIEEIDDEEEGFYEDAEDRDDDGYRVEWLGDCDEFSISSDKERHFIEWKGSGYIIGGICFFKECPSYCGGLIISDIVCDEKTFRSFVNQLYKDTLYSQLICGDVTNEVFLACGAINLGEVLLLEVN